jgi:site-specific recombinase XerD
VKLNKTTTFTFWLRSIKGQPENPIKIIYCRLIQDKSKVDLSTNLKIENKYWCTTNHLAKEKCPNHLLINERINSIKLVIIKYYNEHSNRTYLEKTSLKSIIRNNPLKSNEIDYLKPLNIRDGVDIYIKYLNQQLNNKQIQPKTHYGSVFITKEFLMFFEKNLSPEIDLNQMKKEHINRFEGHLLNIRGQNNNTALRNISRIRQFFIFLYENEYLRNEIKYKTKLRYKYRTRTYLTFEQLLQIDDSLYSNQRIELAKDIFIFSAYTGFAYNELLKLKKENIIKDNNGQLWATIVRQKTSNIQKVPLLEKALSIINKYANESSNKLLPVPNICIYNKLLKLVQFESKIDIKLTSHLGRHTMATTVGIGNGLPIETLSKILGHKSIRTTQIYAKILDTKIIDDFTNLQYRLNLKVKEAQLNS